MNFLDGIFYFLGASQFSAMGLGLAAIFIIAFAVIMIKMRIELAAGVPISLVFTYSLYLMFGQGMLWLYALNIIVVGGLVAYGIFQIINRR